MASFDLHAGTGPPHREILTKTGPFAGSVTAALFLSRFVRNARSWVHLDIFAWAPEARPGRPVGGTDQGIRAVYGVLKQRYS